MISVDLEEHVADAQGRAFVMGDDDFNLIFHVGHYCKMTRKGFSLVPNCATILANWDI